jgi:hypothetical protein
VLFGFGVEREISNDDVAVLGEEETRKGEVDAYVRVSWWLYEDPLEGESVPDPAPVMMAVLPATENGVDMMLRLLG